MIKHGPEIRPVLKDLIPCLHFSESFKNLENLGGVKLKHLLEIQNTFINLPISLGKGAYSFIGENHVRYLCFPIGATFGQLGAWLRVCVR